MSKIAGIRMKNPAHPGGFVKSEIIVPPMPAMLLRCKVCA
jgi:hypothetical protein